MLQGQLETSMEVLQIPDRLSLLASDCPAWKQKQALGDASKEAAKIQPGLSQDRLHSGSLKPGMDRQLSKHLLLTHVLPWAHEGSPFSLW